MLRFVLVIRASSQSETKHNQSFIVIRAGYTGHPGRILYTYKEQVAVKISKKAAMGIVVGIVAIATVIAFSLIVALQILGLLPFILAFVGLASTLSASLIVVHASQGKCNLGDFNLAEDWPVVLPLVAYGIAIIQGVLLPFMIIGTICTLIWWRNYNTYSKPDMWRYVTYAAIKRGHITPKEVK